MQFLMTPNNIPIFWGDGKVYYIYNKYIIGTYDLSKFEDGERGNVKDLYGNTIGVIQWETLGHVCTGYFFNYDAIDTNLISLPDKLNKLDEEEKLKDRAIKRLKDNIHDDKYSVAWRLFAKTSGIEDDKTGEVIYKAGWLDEKGYFDMRPYPDKIDDKWGMMAAFMCYQYFEITAKYHGYFEIKY